MQGRISKDHLLIGIGIGLPLVVILLFVLATSVPKWFVTPPQHDLLFTSYVSAYPKVPAVRVNLDVYQGEVRARIYQDHSALVTKLFRFDHERSRVREVPIPVPDEAEDLPDGTRIRIPEVEDLRLDTSLVSPDGYEFRGPQYQGIGIVPELLGMRRRRSATLGRDGAVIPLTLDPPHYSVQFLGWVVSQPIPGGTP